MMSAPAALLDPNARAFGPALRRLAFAALALLPLAACATHQPVLDADCAANALCAARAAEPALIAQAPALAERKNDTLILHPASATVISFTDSKTACDAGNADNCQGYALMDVVPRAHALVVQQFFYEGSSFLLIDSNTGRATRLNGMPVFSPDASQFLVAPYDLESDVGPNGIEIWRREGDGAVLEWSHAIQQEHVEDPDLPVPYRVKVRRWRPDRISLDLSIEVPEVRHWTGTLTRTTDGWRLDAKSPPGTFPAP